MDRIPILRMGEFLLVTIQVDMHDQLATALEEDLTAKINAERAERACRAIVAPDRPAPVEIEQAIRPMHERLAQLEAENKALQDRLAKLGDA